MANKTEKATNMEIARQIVREAFANTPADESPRKPAIEQMMKAKKDGGLNMKPTTAATYYAHCIAHFREQEQKEALAKAEQGKPVWSVYKTKGDEVSSVGVFLTKKAATAFNKEFRHDGVVKGVQEVGKPVMKARKAA